MKSFPTTNLEDPFQQDTSEEQEMFETRTSNRPGGWWLAAGATLLIAVEGGCGIIRHRTPARCEPGLPCYAGYGQKAIAGQTQGMTFTGMRLIEKPVPEDLLARATPPTPQQPGAAGIVTPALGVGAAPEKPVRLRYFALANAEMNVDHCTLSKASLILWSDGRWELFVRAEQNRPQPPEGVPAGTAVVARSQKLQTSHIKRNEFHIVAKGFGAAQAADTTQDDRVAKPVLLHRAMTPFWVERGQPREMTFEGMMDNPQNFDLIDRFEIEFAYK